MSAPPLIGHLKGNHIWCESCTWIADCSRLNDEDAWGLWRRHTREEHGSKPASPSIIDPALWASLFGGIVVGRR